ncbi:putative lysyl-tRNA synthetase domain protein [Mycobacterium kansasii]|uniref:Putative lysyl-tRNA synthetase domain protein n=1 Tax=Mycobacterium kansasii TaxID=1768 RepID=A0A1V3WIU7_MYCKA|nr:putative lysyl-tRNA synthetase domain protein [Mycobacterium kansasii]
MAEQELDDNQRAELTEMLLASPKGARTDRGFCMSLDGVLEGKYPGVQLIIARDASGRCRASTDSRPRAAAVITPSTCRGGAVVPERDRRAAQRRHDHRRQRGGRAAALAGVRGVPGDLRRGAPEPAATAVLSADPSA